MSSAINYWPRIAEIVRPYVRLDTRGAWWLHYRVFDAAWMTNPETPTDYSIVLNAQDEDEAVVESANRLVIPVECIRRFG